jgi:hypothetical protein
LLQQKVAKNATTYFHFFKKSYWASKSSPIGKKIAKSGHPVEIAVYTAVCGTSTKA